MAVYFFQAGPHGPIKIGSSWDASHRRRMLQAAHWEEIAELAVGPGCQQVEMALHERFADVRIRGDWFWPSAALLEFARQVAAGAVPHLLAGLPTRPTRCIAGRCRECPYSRYLRDNGLPFRSWRISDSLSDPEGEQDAA